MPLTSNLHTIIKEMEGPHILQDFTPIHLFVVGKGNLTEKLWETKIEKLLYSSSTNKSGKKLHEVVNIWANWDFIK